MLHLACLGATEHSADHSKHQVSTPAKPWAHAACNRPELTWVPPWLRQRARTVRTEDTPLGDGKPWARALAMDKSVHAGATPYGRGQGQKARTETIQDLPVSKRGASSYGCFARACRWPHKRTHRSQVCTVGELHPRCSHLGPVQQQLIV